MAPQTTRRPAGIARTPLLLGLALLVVVIGAVLTHSPRSTPPSHSQVRPPVAVLSALAEDRPAIAVEDPLVRPTTCLFDPIVPPRGTADGKFDADAALRVGAARPTAYFAVAQEAVAQQRMRDAETALIAACRAAGMGAPIASVAVASAQERLARLYSALASQDRSQPDLAARARELQAESLAGYTTVLGLSSSRTRMASLRLAQLTAAPAREAAVTYAPDEAGVATATMGAEAAPIRVAPEALSRRTAPALQSAPCSATSQPCGDADLAQASDDLQRLRAQARQVTDDPEGFQRRTDAARVRRDACTDTACLRRWHASRRAELLAEF